MNEQLKALYGILLRGAHPGSLFLIYCCEDPVKFLDDLKLAFETAKKAA